MKSEKQTISNVPKQESKEPHTQKKVHNIHMVELRTPKQEISQIQDFDFQKKQPQIDPNQVNDKMKNHTFVVEKKTLMRQQNKILFTFSDGFEAVQNTNYIQVPDQSIRKFDSSSNENIDHQLFSSILHSIPQGKIASLLFQLQKSCMSTKYNLLKDNKLIFTTQKQRLTLSSKYLLTLGDVICSEIKGNFTGSQYNIYQESSLVATICYDCTLKCQGNIQSTSIYVRQSQYSMQEIEGEGESLKNRYDVGQNKQMKRIVKYVNKKPIYVQRINGFGLNFHGLAKMSSAKNNIFIEEETEKEILLVGKKQQNLFNICIAAPFSIKLAMGILLTVFDPKIISE